MKPNIKIRMITVLLLLGLLWRDAKLPTIASPVEQPKPPEPASFTFQEHSVTLDLSKGVQLPAADNAQSTPPSTIDGWETILYEDPNGDFPSANGWTVYDYLADDETQNGEDYWGEVTCRYTTTASSIWAAGVGDMGDCSHYDHNMYSWMIYGPFDLSDATDAEVFFYLALDSEEDHDFFGWYASPDGVNFSGGRSSGYFNWWPTFIFDLGHLVGDNSVWFGYLFQSDSDHSIVGDYEGAYVDQIIITKETDAPPLIPDIRVEPPSLAFTETLYTTTNIGGFMDELNQEVAFMNLGDGSDPNADTASSESLTIHNDGTADLTVSEISVFFEACWLDVTPSESLPYAVPPGGSLEVNVQVDPVCVEPGDYYDTIWIVSDDPEDDTVDVRVDLNVLEPVTRLFLPVIIR